MSNFISIMIKSSVILLILAAGFILPSVSNAAVINFKVVNSIGTPQAGVTVCHYSNSINGIKSRQYYTDNSGQLTIDDLILDSDKIVFTRDPNKESEHTPENLSSTPGNITIPGCSNSLNNGFSGINYSINGVKPTETVKIVLPKLSNNPVRNISLTSEMRKLVGLINNARVKNGLNKLEISTVLTNAAQNYVDLFAKDGITSLRYFTSGGAHDYKSTSRIRAIDLGYPAYSKPSELFAQIGENLYDYGSSGFNAQRAFQAWWNSPGHKRAILWENSKAIGIGVKGSIVAAKFAGLNDNSFSEQAGLTGDYGDATLPNNPGNNSGNPGNNQNQPRYIKKNTRVKTVFRKRVLVIKRTRAARGKLVIKIRKNGKLIRKVKSKRAVIRIKGRFTGRIRVAGRFVSASPVWKHKRFVRIKRVR